MTNIHLISVIKKEKRNGLLVEQKAKKFILEYASLLNDQIIVPISDGSSFHVAHR